MGRKKQFLLCVLACYGGLVAGTMLGFTAPVIPWLSSNNTDQAPFCLNYAQTSWVASLFPIGAFVGAMPAGVLINALHKRWTMVIFSIPWVLTWIVMVIADSVIYLYVSRFIQGFIIGVLCAAIPTYVGEISEPGLRGGMGSLFQIFITIGICIAYILGVVNSYIIMCSICFGISITYTLGTLFLLDSAIHHLRKGNEESAIHILESTRAADYDIQSEIADLKKYLETSSLDHRITLEDLKVKSNVTSLITAIGLQFGQQLSGINAVIFYTPSIFAQIGAGQAHGTSITLGVVQVIATIVSAVINDKVGRRILLISSALVMAICLTILGLAFYLQESGIKSAFVDFIPVVSMMIYIIMFSIGLGPVPWVLLGELFAPAVKGFGSSVAVSTNWLLAFTVTKFFPLLAGQLGKSFTVLIFAVVCFVTSLLFTLFLRETKGKTLTEIQEDMMNS